jgi:hypothetical protein
MALTTDGAYRTEAEPQEVRRFRLDPAEYWRVQKKSLLRLGIAIAVGAAIGFAPVFVLSARAPSRAADPFPVTWMIAVVVFVPMMISFASIARRVRTAQLGGYELLVTPRVLRRVQPSGGPAEILRPEVTRVVETNDGIWVIGDRPQRALFVTRALDGYADVRGALARWGNVEPLAGFAAFAFAWKHGGHQASRDARAGTALASDPTLYDELAKVRAASADRGAGIGATIVMPKIVGRRMMLGLWVVLIVMFLGIWVFLQAPAPPRSGLGRAPAGEGR